VALLYGGSLLSVCAYASLMTNQKTTKYAKQNMHVQAVVTQQKKDKMNYI